MSGEIYGTNAAFTASQIYRSTVTAKLFGSTEM